MRTVRGVFVSTVWSLAVFFNPLPALGQVPDGTGDLDPSNAYPWLEDVTYSLQHLETGNFHDQHIDLVPEDPIDNLVFQADDRGFKTWAMVDVIVNEAGRPDGLYRANLHITVRQGGESQVDETFTIYFSNYYDEEHYSVFFRHHPCGGDVDIFIELLETGQTISIPVSYTCGE